MRQQLFGWLFEITGEFRHSPQTWFLGCNYVDRFCSTQEVSRAQYQLVGATGLLLAMKFEEIIPLSIDTIVTLTADTYSRTQVLEMETEMLNVLQFELSPPTINQFLALFFHVFLLEDQVVSLASFLSELAVLCYELTPFEPSVVAAACLYLGLRSFDYDWSNDLRTFIGYPQPDLAFPSAIVLLADFWLSLFENIISPNDHPVFAKYSTGQFHQVAQRQPCRFDA